MICLFKCPKSPKLTSIDKAFAPSTRGEIKVDQVLFTPLTAGPFLVPVTRWIE